MPQQLPEQVQMLDRLADMIEQMRHGINPDKEISLVSKNTQDVMNAFFMITTDMSSAVVYVSISPNNASLDIDYYANMLAYDKMEALPDDAEIPPELAKQKVNVDYLDLDRNTPSEDEEVLYDALHSIYNFLKTGDFAAVLQDYYPTKGNAK